MQVVKVLNNSLVFALDNDGAEVILMGKGIGYNKAIGYELRQQDIQKVFVLKDREVSKNIIRLAAEIDSVYFEIAKLIIDYGIETYGMKLMDHLYLALTDHLSFAAKRFESGKSFQNFYITDIKKFNPKEYDVGLYALKVIKEETGLILPEDEIGYIAFHFMNAQQDNPYSSENLKILQVVKDSLDIIKYHLKLVWDEDSISYTRLVTHLKLFAQRLVNGNLIRDKDQDFLYNQITSTCIQACGCVQKIGVYIEKSYGQQMTNQEELYLVIHIHRLIEESKIK